MKELSEVVALEIRAAKIKLVKERPYWTRSDMMLVFDIGRTRMGEIERAGAGPAWLRIGGDQMIAASTADAWFKNLQNSEWAKSKAGRFGT